MLAKSHWPSRTTYGIAAAAALFVGVLAAGSVFTTFQGTRVKIIRQSTAPINGRISATSEPIHDAPPINQMAVVAHVSGADASRLVARVVIDDRPICERAVEFGRIDCATESLDLTERHRVVIEGPASGWSVDALELSTHHGRSRGLGDFIILPSGASFARLTMTAIVGMAVAVLGMMLLPSARWPRPWSLVHFSVTAGIVIAAGIVVIVPTISAYRVIVSSATLIGWTAVAFAPRLWWLASRASAIRVSIPRLPIAWKPRIATLIVGVVSAAAMWSAIAPELRSHGGNYSGFIHIGKYAYDGNPLLSQRDDIRATLMLEDPGGYDGQFMYFSAFDPFLQKLPDRPGGYLLMMDDAVYRYGRIGFGLLTNVVSLGTWQRFPTAMMWLLIASMAVGACSLGALAQLDHRSAAWGGLFLLVPAFWQSVPACLPESLAASLLVVGYLLWKRGHVKTATAAFAYALLVRETAVVFLVCLIVTSWRSHRWTRDRVLLLALVPLAVWRGYLGWIFLPAYGIDAFYHSAPAMTFPFGGIAVTLMKVARGEYFVGNPAFSRAAIALAALQTAGLGLSVWLVLRRAGPVALAALVYSVLAVSMNYGRVWVHVGNAQRVSYEMFLMLAIGAAGVVRRDRLHQTLALFWGLAGLFVFFGAYDAQVAQAALPMLGIVAALWLILGKRLSDFVFQ